MSSPFFDKSFS